ncbi:hypothetical protein NEMBOFW57_001686 [Staphylotrichum longicolle]|uniref:Uncharacterized protein n=1 Tax=Staphylotrichum longicolle TaxID=669026 RepID=A0AAD4F4W5_9PEZI|nr:hypothetical protein NEMBOFW57_001686 [Staphylotrichum longicolle]
MDAMDGTACGRPPGYCNGGAMAGIEVAARGTDAEEVTAEVVVCGGCVTGEAHEENAGEFGFEYVYAEGCDNPGVGHEPVMWPE